MARSATPRVLRPEEAADFLGVSRRWLMREGIRKYKVPFLRPPGSRQIRFLQDDLERVLGTWRESDGVGSSPRNARRSLRYG